MPGRKKYGFWKFMFDLWFGVFTGGVWWFYLLLKHFRTR
jgi:hypothetical protein